MPARYRVLDQGRLVVELWSGNIAHQELVRHLMRRINDPSIETGASVLADGRTATFKTAEEQTPLIANVHRTAEDKMRESNVAMVVREDTLVRANLFAASAAEFGVKIMVFSHFDVACTWLGINPNETQQLLDEIRSDTKEESSKSDVR